MQIPLDLQLVFAALIDELIVARYNSELERRPDYQEGGENYVPLDHDRIYELLVELWGSHITPTAIAEALERLAKDGAAEWPHGWCDEDEKEERVSDLGPG